MNIIGRIMICPVCDEEITSDELDRFDMCVECFTDRLTAGISDILYDFLREYSRELKDYVSDNYNDF